MGGGPGRAGGPIRILQVEDNASDVLLTDEAFKLCAAGAILRVVPDGEQALAYLRRQGEHADAPRPDLILLDLNLPGMGGAEVLASIKSDPDLRRIPVMILSTSEDQQDIVKAYDLHANCYIAKPMDLSRFMKIVATIETFWLNTVRLPPR